MKGYGFVDMGGSDVFVHINDCSGGQPKEGDILSFDVVPRQNNPQHMQAKNVTGGTAPRGSPGFAGPVEGTGAHTGTVKAFGTKGYGFIALPDGSELFMNIKDCVGSKPVPGDTVKFDMGPSDNKPGMLQARNITGGSAPLEPPPGKGGYGSWGGKGAMGGDWWGNGGCGGGGMGKGMGWGGGYGGWGGGCGGFGGGKGGMMGGPYGKGGW